MPKESVTAVPDEILHLQNADVSLIIDIGGAQLPQILYWGTSLGELKPEDLLEIRRNLVTQIVSNVPDVPIIISVLPEASRGVTGIPGIAGSREGRDFSPLFTLTETTLEEIAGTQRLFVRAADSYAELALDIEIEMLPSGLIRQRAVLVNTGSEAFQLDSLQLVAPVPEVATEILDYSGRHLRERQAQRAAFTVGTHLRDSRRGRTGADATLIMAAGETGFGFRSGETWAVHTAWSGNHRTFAERIATGVGLLGGGELILPGEIRLAKDESYASPWIYFSYGNGLDRVSDRFHDYLRSRPTHPSSPRPVNLNVWEAVYFDHDFEKLSHLAELSARIGVERFVLDDGWFGSRRDDHSGLGDWVVSPEVWPEGLHPLVNKVRDLGMVFGLWVEPEMVNLDSDLAREHPEWIMHSQDRIPLSSRQQQVLNLAHPQAYDRILGQLRAVLDEYEIGYLKWDHNRDLIEAGWGGHGAAAVHEQTLAAYRMLRELKQLYPGLEIESCASGGSRIDLGIIEYTDRVWASDRTDAHDRHAIQWGTEVLLPPEYIGAHISSTNNHSSGRTLDLDFRSGTAFFDHFGIEWDISEASEDDLDKLAVWIKLYRQYRQLLHTGRVIHLDYPDPALWVRGAVSEDQTEAIFSLALLQSSRWAPPGLLRLDGLDEDRFYAVKLLPPADLFRKQEGRDNLSWADGIVLKGAVLKNLGLQIPALNPDHLVMLHLTAQ